MHITQAETWTYQVAAKLVCRFREGGPFSFLDYLTNEILPYIYIYMEISKGGVKGSLSGHAFRFRLAGAKRLPCGREAPAASEASPAPAARD